jgi:hypothetical protein
MTISASTLRGNIYNLLDEVLETGQPLVIERKGKLLQIIPRVKNVRVKDLVKHDCINGDPEEIIHMNWTEEWHSDLP